jgi:hypothetical protein
VKQGDSFAFEQANPFAEPGEQVGSVGYRYRKWNLGDDVTLVVRCEADAFNRTPKNEMQFATIKALNEYDSKATGVDWRQKLDSQKGAVLATELKNNSNKLAKWTIGAILNGSDTMTLGYAHARVFYALRSGALFSGEAIRVRVPRDISLIPAFLSWSLCERAKDVGMLGLNPVAPLPAATFRAIRRETTRGT